MPASREETPTAPLAALFPNRECAEMAHGALVRRGYRESEISVVMWKEDEPLPPPLAAADHAGEVGEKAAARSAKGAAIGGTAGALIGILAAAGSVVIPGLGLVLAGPIAALAGLAAGGVAGGVAGALVGAGVPVEEARGLASELRGGGILLAVRPRSLAERGAIRTEWEGFSATRIRELPLPEGERPGD